MMNQETNLEKLQRLLRDMFQFDSAELDFGIYRIMNYKRDIIDTFINKDLPEAISDELSKGALSEQSEAAKELEKLKGEIIKSFGNDALDADENLNEAYNNTPLGKKYLDLRKKTEGGHGREAFEGLIYNHLYSFLSRYYDNGDFISKRRYSKKEKYAIPYNGEEVFLHWANSDQYYIKTGEYFQDYTFKSQGIRFHFKLSNADVEQNNVKGDTRFFLPHAKDIAYDKDAKEVTIPFEYRPLTEQEQISFGKKNQQENILGEALKNIPAQFGSKDTALAALSVEHHKTANGTSVSVLEHHLRRYTRRNTSDFFIHKDLKGFLNRELDFYLKNEVLNLDELETAGEDRSEGWFQIMRTIKNIGSKVISFLAQIEDFQKKLFEKKKFVTEIQYCITVGNIPHEFYEEIAKNDAQWIEWKELLHIDEEKKDLFTPNDKKERRIKYLVDHPTLAIDTQYFDIDFKDTLLMAYVDIEAKTNSLLIYSENFQALNLLKAKYNGKAKCIYIDPPYNTKKGRFPYKDGYKSSSWIAFMEDRLKHAREMLREDGVFWCSIDTNELFDLDLLCKKLFLSDNRVGEIIWKNARDNNPTRIATEHEYILCYSRDLNKTEQAWKNEFADAKELLLTAYESFKNKGLSSSQIQAEVRRFIGDNKVLLAEVDRYKFVDKEGVYTGSQSVHNPHPGGYEYDILHPTTKKPMRMPVNGYRFPEETMRRDFIEKDRLIYGPDENRIVQIKVYLKEYKDSLRSVIDLDGRLGAYSLNDLFGKGSNVYENPKPPQLLDRLLSFSSLPETLVVDFFAGSGTTAQAVMEVARRTGVDMRYILTEFDRCFDTVILPRIKKLAFTPYWKNGKPLNILSSGEKNVQPYIIKYIRLESYEDALNNISFSPQKGQKTLEFDDYKLKYMLEWETKDSDTFLNIEKLTSPFSYKLDITKNQETKKQVIDLPETFNYLLGLHVKTRRVYYNGKQKYLVYRGNVDHREIAVIWRETKDWKKQDFEKDKKFVADQKITEGVDEIFVNSDSVIPRAKSLDPIFKNRMFAKVQ